MSARSGAVPNEAAAETSPPIAPAPNQAQLDHLARQKAQDIAMVAGLKGQLNRVLLPPSPLLRNQRVSAWVYLPPGYDGSTTRYPVVYLLHGAPGEARDWLVNAKVQRVADTLISDGKVAPMILVAYDAYGPKGLNDVQNYLDRSDGTYQMESFTTQTLVPWVDANFRTRADANSRALVGFSAGGYGAANMGGRHHDLWKVVASVAGFFDPSDDAENITPILGPKSSAWDDNSPLIRASKLPQGAHLHFYMDCGRDDPLFHEFLKMKHELKARGAEYEVQELNGDHAWDYLHDRMFEVLKFCDRSWMELSTKQGGGA